MDEHEEYTGSDGFWDRFQVIPFWKLTNHGWLPEYFFRLQKGCDEWHNKSRYLILPLVGELVVFYEKKFQRSSRHHLWGRFNGVWEGFNDPNCDLCAEFIADADTP